MLKFATSCYCPVISGLLLSFFHLLMSYLFMNSSFIFLSLYTFHSIALYPIYPNLHFGSRFLGSFALTPIDILA